MTTGLLHQGPPLPALTVGQRNNNFGNLRSNDPFVGKTGSNGYDIYDTPENGLRALARTLHTYGTKRGIKTIGGLVDRYAPAGDNSDAARNNYKQLLAGMLNVGVDDEIDIAANRLPLMRGIIQFENGKQLASDDMINSAIAAADGTQDQGAEMATDSTVFGLPINTDQARLARNLFQGNPLTRGMANYIKVNNAGLSTDAEQDTQQRRMSLEDDYQIGKSNGGMFLYQENRERYEAEKRAQNSQPMPALPNAMAPPAAAGNTPVLTVQPDLGLLPDITVNQSAQAAEDDLDDLIASAQRAAQARTVSQAPPMNQSLYPSGLYSNQVQGVQNTTGGNGILNDYEYEAAQMAAANPTQSPTPGFQFMPPPPREVDANPQTSQRRNKSVMSFDPGIDFNEQLIRIGLAGVGGSQQGALNAFGQMGQMYGAIQDANRSNAIAAYNASLKGNKTTKADADDRALLDKVDSTLFTMDEALGYLNREKNGEGGGLTGLLDATIGAGWDRMMGNPEAMGRRLLEQLRVDDALLRVAQTKGAISNHEMRLFLSPAPTKFDDEQVWIDWINQRRRAAMRIKDRLNNGRRVASDERATSSQIDQYSSQGGSSFEINGVTIKKL